MCSLDVHIITGGSGRTGRAVLQACIAQFPKAKLRTVLHCKVTSEEQIRQIVEQASASSGVVCHSLVQPQLRSFLFKFALADDVPCVDLLGPTIAVLGDRLRTEPAGQAGLLYELHREHFDRMDAVDFTLSHDDGRSLCSIEKADVVIVGVSRVSKSVTCFYLASRGIRAANVPLVGDMEIAYELKEVDPNRVFALTMNASRLRSVRKARLERIAASEDMPSYTEIRVLNREIREVDSIIAQHGWTRIDVSYKATEEVASEIIDSLSKIA